MKFRIEALVCLLLVCGSALPAPAHAPWPGGLAVLRIDANTQPEVTFGESPVLVIPDGEQWAAVVGIPLDADPDLPLQLTIRGEGEEPRTADIELVPADYRVQRLTVEQKYVDPGMQALDRIFAERKIIDSALANFRPVPLQRIELAAPAPGARSSSFGSRRIFNNQPRSPHKGMDISAPEGTPILAPLDGLVTATGDYYFNGNTVIVDHGQGLVSLYCHLSKTDVAEGQQVSAGDSLGEVGRTGRVTGAHLHFATYLNGTAVDPALLLKTD